ncbi:hypothetical protein K438DRAFT_1760021 [Mycena galopus ATCC 62051]|nr:hypothetical protein K438DRAFT_1760021 [Mycena galopus ATCC 62051]
MNELERLLVRLPGVILDTFWDETEEKSNGLSATLKGKGPVGRTASNRSKQPQRKEGEIEPDDDDIDTNVFEGTHDFLEALYCQLICLAGPDPRLSVESNPLQFNKPPHSNSGATDSST